MPNATRDRPPRPHAEGEAILPIFGFCRAPGSAELKGPGKLLSIRPEIFYLGPDLGLKGSKTKPKYPVRYPDLKGFCIKALTVAQCPMRPATGLQALMRKAKM